MGASLVIVCSASASPTLRSPTTSGLRSTTCSRWSTLPDSRRLRLSFDPERLWLAIHLDGQPLVAGGLDPASRARMCDAVGEFVQSLPTSALRDRPDRLPLRLVGDGVTPRHQDDPDPYVTLHSRASLDAVRGVIGDPELDEVRFRTNIVIDKVEPWAELGWVGRRLRIGNVEAVVDYACERCLATHADPVTGQRDRSISKALVQGFQQSEPTFAVALEFRGPGTIRIGDPVELLA